MDVCTHQQLAEPITAQSDEWLLEHYQRAECEEAFSEMVRRYEKLAYRVAFSRCGQPGLAEEIVQEVFLFMAQSRDLKIRGPFKPWLFAIVTNIARHRYRSEQRCVNRTKQPQYRHEVESVSQQRTPNDSSVQPMDERTRQKLTQALAELAEEIRLPLVLHFIEGLSQEEVGKLMGVSQPMTSRRIASGLEKLRLRLAQAGVALSAAMLPVVLKDAGLLEVTGTLRGKLAATTLKGAAQVARVSRYSVRMTRVTSSGKGAALWLVLSFSALGLGAWWVYGGTPKPAIIPAPKLANVEESAQVGFWSFPDGPAPDLRILQSEWTWKRFSDPAAHGLGVMLANMDANTVIEFPQRLKAQPMKLRIQGRIHGNGSSTIDAFWSDGHRILPIVKKFIRTKAMSGVQKFLDIEVYIYDQYIIHRMDGQVTGIFEYATPYPGSRMCMLIRNHEVSELELTYVRNGEIPQALRQPGMLTEKMTALDAAFEVESLVFPPDQN